MKRLLATLLFLPLAAAAADIAVQRLAGEPSLDPLSPAWLAQPPASIKVYPQTSVPPTAAQAATGNVKLRAQAGAAVSAR